MTWPKCISVGSWELAREARWTQQWTTYYMIAVMQKQHVYKSHNALSCLFTVCFLRLPKVGGVCHRLQQRPTHTPVCHQLITSSIRSLPPSCFLHLVLDCFSGCVLVVFFFLWLLCVLLTCALLAFVSQSELPRHLFYLCLTTASVASSTTFMPELPPSPPPSTAIPHSVHFFVFTHSLSLLLSSKNNY